MTTTDARKRNRDARGAAWMLAALDGTGEPRDRTHDDFHREWLHVMDTQHPHTPQETDMPNNQRRHREQMGVLDQIYDTLAEIRDRLPEREVACGDVWRDETERPCTRPSGHDGNHVDKVGTIWANPEPAPADVGPDEALGAKGDELEDLRKARWYLDREIERLTEPSVNVTEGPDLSTEDAGTSSEPADITEEPPVGTQVTDRDGDVWERREDGWATWNSNFWSSCTIWNGARNYGPLRPTTDADRVRVGLRDDERAES